LAWTTATAAHCAVEFVARTLSHDKWQQAARERRLKSASLCECLQNELGIVCWLSGPRIDHRRAQLGFIIFLGQRGQSIADLKTD
jgi:hypothetical protein